MEGKSQELDLQVADDDDHDDDDDDDRLTDTPGHSFSGSGGSTRL